MVINKHSARLCLIVRWAAHSGWRLGREPERAAAVSARLGPHTGQATLAARDGELQLDSVPERCGFPRRY